MAPFPGMVTQRLSPCPSVFWSLVSQLPRNLSPHHTLIRNGFQLLSAKSGFIDPKHDEKKVKPWKQAIVETPLWEATQPTTTLNPQDAPPLSPKNGPTSTVLGTFIYMDSFYSHNNLKMEN